MTKNKNGKAKSNTDTSKNEFAVKNIGGTYQNLENQVYEMIKNKIIWHEIKMGDRIIDKKIAEELGVSRSMVRHVFAILVEEQLLKKIPRSGFYVKEITKKEIEEIYEIRKLLEPYALKCGTSRISDKAISEIENLFKKTEKPLKNRDDLIFIKIDVKLHELIIDSCGNDYIKKIINGFRNRIDFYRFAEIKKKGRGQELFSEHWEIFNSIKKGNVELTIKLLNRHIENSKKSILDDYDKYTYG